jgi:hypothetical protein
VGAGRANAIQAYEKGATGKGVTAAIIDDSFAPALSQFAGRVHPASGDMVGSRPLNGEHHHGTWVTSVLGAAKDDNGMHGVAFESTLLMLRTDVPGTCSATSPTCQFDQVAIAKAFDVAIQNGARVINMSMGFIPAPASLAQAIDKATAAGVVVIITAGNNASPDPIASALIATKAEARGTVIIAGALNNAGTALSNSSDRAGIGADFYLAAVGEGVPVYDKNGALVSANGTSFSAPAISGAVALLAQAFPNLTGKQIVDLLLTTGTDMGASGTDNIYGRGALNLANAFAPQGTMSLAGSMAPVSLTSNGMLSVTMGDAKGELQGAVFLDGYDRAYETDLGGTLSRTAPDAPLHAALDGSYSTSSAALGPLAVSITTSRDPNGPLEARLGPMELSVDQARSATAIAATAVGRLSPRTAVALGVSEGGRALRQRLSGLQANAFLVARDPAGGNGFQLRPRSGIGIRHDFGPLAFTLTSEFGEVHDPYPARQFGRSAYRTTSIGADRRLGRVRLSFGGSLLDEEATILGGRFSPAFTSAGSTSWFADGAAALSFGKGWSGYGSYRRGWTRIRGGAGLVQGGVLASDAFAFDLAKAGAFTGGDRLALRVSQPLRVRSGGFDINLPVRYDYASRSVGYEPRFLNLAPAGREIDYELSYDMRLLGGHFGANAFLRTNPGHVEARKDDIGAAIRFALGF